MITEPSCQFTLSGDSAITYIFHEDVSAFISFALREGICGLFNMACKGSITLCEMAAKTGCRATFGEYKYDLGEIDNSKIAGIFPAFRRTCQEVVDEFIRCWHKHP